jgi:uncharacterized protein YjbI with pentapeptide repeats
LDLKDILDARLLWCDSAAKGNRADLTGENLSGLNLKGVNLWSATLQRGNLSNVNFVRIKIMSLRGLKKNNFKS